MRYGAVPDVARPQRSRRGATTIAVVALLASAALVGIALQSASAPEELAGPGYVKWLRTLTGKGDYQTGDEYDPTFDSSGMPHADISEMVHSALPKSPRVAQMQGDDFANDVVESALPPVDQDLINGLPRKLRRIKDAIAKEKVFVGDLKDIVDAHSLPQPESIVVHVGQRGPRGAEGKRGPRGPTGDQGTKGPTGPLGPEGDVGPRGLQGERGPTGDEGPVGDQGRTGYPGRPGVRGEVGVEGVQGLEGDPGRDGEVGPPGPQGPNGPNGMEGEKGQIGNEGARGNGIPITCLAVVKNICYSLPQGNLNWNQAKDKCEAWDAKAAVMSFRSVEQWNIAKEAFAGVAGQYQVSGPGGQFRDRRRFWAGLSAGSSWKGDKSADWKFRTDGLSNKIANTLWSSLPPTSG